MTTLFRIIISVLLISATSLSYSHPYYEGRANNGYDYTTIPYWDSKPILGYSDTDNTCQDNAFVTCDYDRDGYEFTDGKPIFDEIMFGNNSYDDDSRNNRIPFIDGRPVFESNATDCPCKNKSSKNKNYKRKKNNLKKAKYKKNKLKKHKGPVKKPMQRKRAKVKKASSKAKNTSSKVTRPKTKKVSIPVTNKKNQSIDDDNVISR